MTEISKIQIGKTSYDVVDESARERITTLETVGTSVGYATTAGSAEKAEVLKYTSFVPYDDESVVEITPPSNEFYIATVVLNISGVYRLDFLLLSKNGTASKSSYGYIDATFDGTKWTLTCANSATIVQANISRMM